MVFFFLFILFFFPSTTNTPCHPDGVPRTRGDEGPSASAPFILTLFLTLTPCFELRFMFNEFKKCFQFYFLHFLALPQKVKQKGLAPGKLSTRCTFTP